MENEELLNLSEVRFVERSNVVQLYKQVAEQASQLGFDIYDYYTLFTDAPTNALIRSGNTIGCFYIESPGMRSLLQKLNTDTFEMLTAASSIIRPGVAESGMMQEFIARHRDPARRVYLVPEMQKYLGETYGVMVYQEDVIKVAHHIAGLSLEEADLLRRAMSGKMRSKKAMEEIENRFFSSCKDKGLKPFVSNELWRQIKSFAGYSFCKAHSASFALLSYQVTYLKAHFPAEFMASVLTNRGGYYAPAVYISEAKRMGLTIYLPCVNRSEYHYKGKGRRMRIGFMAIKHLTYTAVEAILSVRKEVGSFTGLYHFLLTTEIGKADAVALAQCGAFDTFGLTRPVLLRKIDIFFHQRKEHETGMQNLFAEEDTKIEQQVGDAPEFSIEQRCFAEMEAFDYIVSRHPLDFFPSVTAGSDIVQAKDLPKLSGKRVKLVGWFVSSKRTKTKKGEIMKFLSLEDKTATFEAILFPKVYATVAEKTISMGPYIVQGVVDREMPSNIVVEQLDVVSLADVKLGIQWDSYEKQYGDSERVSEEELELVKTLDVVKMRLAYAG